MNFDKEEILIKNAFESIYTPEYKIDINIKKESRKYRGARRCLALAIVLCMFVSVGVMGATIPSFNKLISKVSPEVADYLYPCLLYTSFKKKVKEPYYEMKMIL